MLKFLTLWSTMGLGSLFVFFWATEGWLLLPKPSLDPWLPLAVKALDDASGSLAIDMMTSGTLQ